MKTLFFGDYVYIRLAYTRRTFFTQISTFQTPSKCSLDNPISTIGNTISKPNNPKCSPHNTISKPNNTIITLAQASSTLNNAIVTPAFRHLAEQLATNNRSPSTCDRAY